MSISLDSGRMCSLLVAAVKQMGMEPKTSYTSSLVISANRQKNLIVR